MQRYLIKCYFPTRILIVSRLGHTSSALLHPEKFLLIFSPTLFKRWGKEGERIFNAERLISSTRVFGSDDDPNKIPAELHKNPKNSPQVILIREKLDILKKTEAANRTIIKEAEVNEAKEEKEEKPVEAITEDSSTSTMKLKLKKRQLERISLDRNFLTPEKAMHNYLLNAHDLEGLRTTIRRSPHGDEPSIVVLWRKDVIAKATEVWGSLEEIHNEKSRRRETKSKIDEDISILRNLISKYKKRRETEWNIEDQDENKSKLLVGSGRVILVAIMINASNFIIKLWACWMTGSQSMFAEAVHSLADTANQCILAYGIHMSGKQATRLHPYGYANMKNLASLVSGVGIFCVGAGLSFYHGINGLINHATLYPNMWAFFLLGGAALSESAPLIMGINEISKKSKEQKISFKDFVMRGIDPALCVLLLEDFASLSGVLICGTCIGLSTYYQTPIPDAIGSLLIGSLLACVATFIIKTNGAALVGRSIPMCSLEKMNASLEADVMVRAIHDVKGIDIGNNQVRYKAEIDFDGKELTRAYIDKITIEDLYKEVKKFENMDEFEDCILKHGEAIVDSIGAEIDRIEGKLKKEFPEVRHADLEIL